MNKKRGKKSKSKKSLSKLKTPLTTYKMSHILKDYSSKTTKQLEESFNFILAEPVKESLMKLVPRILTYVGCKENSQLRNKDHICDKRSELIKTVVEEYGGVNVKESIERTDFYDYLQKFFIHYFSTSNISKKSRKKKMSELINILIDWIMMLASCEVRSIRKESVDLMLLILGSLFEVPKIFDSKWFLTVYQSLVSNFLVKRLNDIDTVIQYKILSFLTSSLKKNDEFFGSDVFDVEARENVFKIAILYLYKGVVAVRGGSYDFLVTVLEKANKEIKDSLFKVLSEKKGILIETLLKAHLNEFNKLLIIIKHILREEGIFTSDDRNFVSLMVYSPHKNIARKAAEFLTRQFFYYENKIEDFTDEKLFEFLEYCSSICAIRFNKITFFDLGEFFNGFCELFDIEKCQTKLKETLDMVCTRGVTVSTFNYSFTFLSFLFSFCPELYKSNDRYFEDELLKHFGKVLEKDSDHDTDSVNAFINLCMYQINFIDNPAIKDFLTDLSTLLNWTKEKSIISSIYDLYHKHRNYPPIKEQFNVNYSTYQESLKQSYASSSIPNLQVLLYKIVLLARELYTERDLFNDFKEIKTIINNYKEEKWKMDPELILKNCLKFSAKAFAGTFMQLLYKQGDKHVQYENFRKAREEVIILLNGFMGYSTNVTIIDYTCKMSIRIEAFIQLMNVYLLISHDSISDMNFAYYYLHQSNIKSIMDFLDTNTFKKDSFNEKVGTSYKKTIQSQMDDSDSNYDMPIDSIDKSSSFIRETPEKPKRKKMTISQQQDELSKEHTGRIQLQKLICSKLAEVLKTCNNAFYSHFAPKIFILFLNKKNHHYSFNKILQGYAKFLFEKDKKEKSNRYWNCLYSILQTLHNQGDEANLTLVCKFFLRYYLSYINSKTIEEEDRKRLFKCFVQFILSTIDYAIKKKAAYLLKLLDNLFLKEQLFKVIDQTLKRVLLELCMKRKETEKDKDYKADDVFDAIYVIQTRLAQETGILNLENKENEQSNSIAMKEEAIKEEEIIKEEEPKIKKEAKPSKSKRSKRSKRHKAKSETSSLNESKKRKPKRVKKK